jgi:hypothetical protein
VPRCGEDRIGQPFSFPKERRRKPSRLIAVDEEANLPAVPYMEDVFEGRAGSVVLQDQARDFAKIIRIVARD